MDAIHINTKLDSDTLYLPQVRPLIGKSVEIIVREAVEKSDERNGRSRQREAWRDALAALAELDVDWDAYKRQREFDVSSASNHTL